MTIERLMLARVAAGRSSAMSRMTLLWMPSSRLAVAEIDDECCTHVLIDRLHGTCVRVIEAAAEWAPEKIEASLVS
jgi:hypothetical protein